MQHANSIELPYCSYVHGNNRSSQSEKLHKGANCNFARIDMLMKLSGILTNCEEGFLGQNIRMLFSV